MMAMTPWPCAIRCTKHCAVHDVCSHNADAGVVTSLLHMGTGARGVSSGVTSASNRATCWSTPWQWSLFTYRGLGFLSVLLTLQRNELSFLEALIFLSLHFILLFQHHIKYQHLLKKKYVCPHPSCGRLFRLQKQLLRHAKHHTGTFLECLSSS